MFITATDFDNLPYVIPNLDKTPNVMPAFVAEYEEAILLSLLGSSLYADFIAGLAALPGVWVSSVAYPIDAEVSFGISTWKSLSANQGVTPVEGTDWTKLTDDRWLKLKNGADYLYYGKTYKWCGMVKALRPYIYSQYVSDTFYSNTGLGIAISNAENSNIVNPTDIICKSWNDFASRVGNCNEPKNTLYGFLSQEGQNHLFDDTFGDDFTDFNAYLNHVFTDPGRRNIFGL
jgi:hypothetical protein